MSDVVQIIIGAAAVLVAVAAWLAARRAADHAARSADAAEASAATERVRLREELTPRVDARWSRRDEQPTDHLREHFVLRVEFHNGPFDVVRLSEKLSDFDRERYKRHQHVHQIGELTVYESLSGHFDQAPGWEGCEVHDIAPGTVLVLGASERSLGDAQPPEHSSLEVECEREGQRWTVAVPVSMPETDIHR